MNIWIFNHHAQGPDIPGGTRHYDLAKGLISKGHSVTIFAAGFHYTLLKETVDYAGKSYLLEDKEGVRFVWVKTFPYRVNNFKRMLNILSYAWKLYFVIPRLGLEKPDLVIGSTVHPFAPWIAVRFSKVYHCPFIYEIRDLWPQTFIDMGIWKKESLKARFFKWLEKCAVNNAEAVISLSPMTQAYLKNEYDYDETVYIPNSVDIEAFVKRQTIEYTGGLATIDKVLALKREGAFIIVFTGAIVQSNNIEIILETARRIEDQEIRLVLVGEGQEKERFREIADKMKLKNLSFLSSVPKQYLPYLISLADLLLLVQGKVNWGSSNKLYDYLAAKKPIVTALHASHNNIVEEIDCGFSCTDSICLAEKITALKNMGKAEREQKGENAFAYVTQNHDIKQMTNMLESLFYKIMKAQDD